MTWYILDGDEVQIVRVWQTRIHNGGWPGLAIDDNFSSRFRDLSCAHTCFGGENNFWVAEMNRPYTLTGVRIQFSTDVGCKYLDVIICLLCTLAHYCACTNVLQNLFETSKHSIGHYNNTIAFVACPETFTIRRPYIKTSYRANVQKMTFLHNDSLKSYCFMFGF